MRVLFKKQVKRNLWCGWQGEYKDLHCANYHKTTEFQNENGVVTIVETCLTEKKYKKQIITPELVQLIEYK